MSDIHGTRDELVAMIVLRSEETRIANAVAKMERDCSAANRAEIERLRAALSEIADGDAHHDGAPKFMAIARAALEQKAAAND